MLVLKIRKLHDKLASNTVITSLVLSFIILVSLVFKTGIPVILVFAYVALFNKKFMLAILLTLPLYDAYIPGGWLSINKIGIIIFTVIFLFNISYKKIRIKKYEFLILLLMAVVTFSYIVAMVNPLFGFMRDGIIMDYLLNVMPKFGFILAFVLAVRTSGKFSMKEMMETATVFVPVFIILISILAIMSKSSISRRRYEIMNVRPNFYSLFITCAVPFIVRLYFVTENKIIAAGSVVSLGSVIFLLSLTASRTGIVLLAVSLFLSFIIFIKGKKGKGIVLISLLIAGGAGALLLPTFQNLLFRLFKSNDITSLTNLLPDRLLLSKTALKIFAKNPLLGYGGMKDASALLILQEIGMEKASHNSYLDIAIQYGVSGLIAFTAVYLTFLGDFTVKIFSGRKTDSWQYPIYIVFINLLLAGLVLSLNFRDIHIYCLAFLAALPYKESIGEENGH